MVLGCCVSLKIYYLEALTCSIPECTLFVTRVVADVIS